MDNNVRTRRTTGFFPARTALMGTLLLAGCAQDPVAVVSGYNGGSVKPVLARASLGSGPAKLQAEPAEIAATPAHAAEATVPSSIAVESIEPAAGDSSARQTGAAVTPALAAGSLIPTTAQRPAVAPRPAQTPTQPAVEMVKHVVGPTDTVYSIASRYHTSAAAILKQNGLADVTGIKPGMVLDIPSNSSPRVSFFEQVKQNLAETRPAPLPSGKAIAGTGVAAPTAQIAARTTAQTATPVTPATTAADVALIEPAAGPVTAPAAALTAGGGGGISPAPDEMGLVSHRVEQGETIYRISRNYKISVIDIMAANEFETPQDLKYGTLVKIPVKTPAADAIAAAEPAAGPAVNPAALQPAAAPEAIVKTETSAAVASAVEKAVEADGKATADGTAAPVEAARETAAAPGGSAGVSAEDTEEAEKSADAKNAATPKQVASATDELKAELKRGQVDPVASRAEGKVWPVKGKIIRKFGQDSTGATYTGINIAVPAGTPVLATDAGSVLYADDGLKTYGKLVLLRHKDGTVSAYAHNGHLLVRKGENVKKGQVIAMSGSSGNVDAPQLHFELRQHASAVDPMRVLPQL